MYAIGLGFVASFFFAFTFVLNRAMGLEGSSWLWSSSLRFWFMIPLLILIVIIRGGLIESLQHLYKNLRAYLIWSTVGFGLFYAPLTFSSDYAPSWLVAGSWQITIIAGSLLMPWINKHPIPWKSLRWSLVILLGIALMLFTQSSSMNISKALLGFVPVVFAAFMYPLGNRKMMIICDGKIDTLQRVLNMTLASVPFWILISIFALLNDGLPSQNQLIQSFWIALFSGVIATVLFFAATQHVSDDPHKLAAVEATQSGELLFALVGEMAWLGSPLPHILTLIGIFLVMAGMCAHSLLQK